jgi:electron transfer flavoprotein alpha subunit
MSVLVVVEHSGGALRGVSLEAVAAGRQLGLPVAAAILGENLEAMAAELAARGVERVWRVEHPLLRAYSADGYTHALEALIRRAPPAFVLFPHTYQARDFAPKLAARFGRALVSDVARIRQDDGALIFVRQLFQGKLNAEARPRGAGPHFASIQAGACRAEAVEAGAAPVEVFVPELSPEAIRTRAEAPFRESERTVDLSSAPVIVGVGRGIQEQGNLAVVEALAEALGAELAASRPVCDNGWLPLERQVGSSGQTIAPRLYVAAGISGAIQHLVGIKESKTIVAINKDENAPIFEVADYGIAGDLFEVVPALVEAIRKSKG